MCDPHERGAYPVEVVEGTIDPRGAIAAIARDVAAGVGAAVVAAKFHNGVARATVEACSAAASSAGVDRVVLSGGVFLNRRLLETCIAGLERAGLRTLVPERLPPGDGGISYGQAAVAAARGSGAR